LAFAHCISELEELFRSTNQPIGCRMPNKYKLTDRVIQLLQAAGWSESRAVDTQSTVAWLQDQGYEIGPLASDVLSNCLGLKVRAGDRTVEIDPGAGLLWLSDESPQYIQAFMKEPACPIGGGELMVILMGVSGRFALLKDDWIGYQDADTFGEVLERLLFPSEYPLRWHDLDRAQCPPDL
jgi:hypothetical protein